MNCRNQAMSLRTLTGESPRLSPRRTDHSRGCRGSACSRGNAPWSVLRRDPAGIVSAPVRLHHRGTAWRTSVASRSGAICSNPARLQQPSTTYQTTFADSPLPHTLPRLLTARNILPFVTSAAEVQRSRACFAHCGIGTVRMCPPLPVKSTMAQWPWRIWTSSVSSPTNSDRRNPQPNSIASMA